MILQNNLSELCITHLMFPAHHIVLDLLFSKRNVSGLPFYDVMLIEDLPKSASLPVATVQQAKARIIDGRWDFDFLFFSESDQVR